jgi:hypothetical protein
MRFDIGGAALPVSNATPPEVSPQAARRPILDDEAQFVIAQQGGRVSRRQRASKSTRLA